ncbi:HEXXH motif domain-containing protein [Actinoplanes sp. NPDC026670]|uniref:HEXXH motif domain-containing protein n=1 Tax=Actinoplanes sp. NPDC026670 TaxID=3154700 RepID=UPI0033CC587C
MTTTYHQLAPEQFDLLATGGGGASGVTALLTAQRSKHLMMIGYLLSNWPGPDGDRLAATLDAVRAADVLSAPLVGAWASIACRAVRHDSFARAEFTQLGAVLVVAGAATGIDVEAEVPVRDGLVALPGVGAVPVPGGDSTRAAARDGRITVDGGPAAGMLPVRYLTSAYGERTIRLGLDDLDPYRHGHHAPPAPRLSAGEVARWQRLLDEAWTLLAARAPERADELAAGLRTLVPLIDQDGQSSRSATLRHAFGAFGLTRPASPTEFAVTLVHEFQHSKLSAVLDLTTLSDPDDEQRYFAPWRVDPRPLAGLLQGVYAFVGVADTWRALRGDAASGALAEREFAKARLQVDRALDTVEHAGALTADGRRLATRLRTVVDGFLAETVTPAAAGEAEQALERTRQAWLTRNA